MKLLLRLLVYVTMSPFFIIGWSFILLVSTFEWAFDDSDASWWEWVEMNSAHEFGKEKSS